MSDREQISYIDGTRVFTTREDTQREAEIAAIVEKAWGCKCHSYGPLATVDWWIERQGRIVGLAEVKDYYTHDFSTRRDWWIPFRKWLALTLGSVALGVPGAFIVRYTDALRYVLANEVDTSKVRIGGTPHRNTTNAMEPMIDIPSEKWRLIK